MSLMKKILAILITPIFLASCITTDGRVEEWDENKKVWVYVGDCFGDCNTLGGWILLNDGTRYAPKGRYRIVRAE